MHYPILEFTSSSVSYCVQVIHQRILGIPVKNSIAGILLHSLLQQEAGKRVGAQAKQVIRPAICIESTEPKLWQQVKCVKGYTTLITGNVCWQTRHRPNKILLSTNQTKSYRKEKLLLESETFLMILPKQEKSHNRTQFLTHYLLNANRKTQTGILKGNTHQAIVEFGEDWQAIINIYAYLLFYT